MYAEAEDLIQKYINNNLSKSFEVLDEEEFKSQSYSKWALEEFKNRCIEEELKFPPSISGKIKRDDYDILCDFIDELSMYAHMNVNSKNIFDTAIDTLIEVLSLDTSIDRSTMIDILERS